jgi:hypothetical protein
MHKRDEARQAAIAALHFNLQGPLSDLPRTAGWGYPEPYTRDLMLSCFGYLTQPDEKFHRAARAVLESLANNQSPLGQIPSLAHDPTDLGASDTTPLFLVGLGLYRRQSGESDFLQPAAYRAFDWLAYQRPEATPLISQLPTSDWRDEQWVLGHGLYVNALYYIALRLHGQERDAARLQQAMARFDVDPQYETPASPAEDRPYYALWFYKMFRNQRFDLLGNSLAILSGLFSAERARRMIEWVEAECVQMRSRGELGVRLPPNLFPFIQPRDPDWYPRLDVYNPPGAYHNGGIWPFICGFYVAALVHAGFQELAEQRLDGLTDLVSLGRQPGLAYGFNEWYQAQTGQPSGQDWQTWSAALYLYALASVESRSAPFFDLGFPSAA